MVTFLVVFSTVFVAIMCVSWLSDGARLIVRMADALERIADALEADEETGGADDES